MWHRQKWSTVERAESGGVFRAERARERAWEGTETEAETDPTAIRAVLWAGASQWPTSIPVGGCGRQPERGRACAANGPKYRNKSFSSVPWHVWLRGSIKKPAILLFEIIALERKKGNGRGYAASLEKNFDSKRKGKPGEIFLSQEFGGAYYKQGAIINFVVIGLDDTFWDF